MSNRESKPPQLSGTKTYSFRRQPVQKEVGKKAVSSAPAAKPSSKPSSAASSSSGSARGEKAVADKKAKEETDKKAKEETGKKAKEETDKKAKEEADKKAKEEANRKAKEEADRLADKKVKEEADKKAKEETDKKAKEEADKKAKEEANRKTKEEADRLADKKVKEETDKKAKEEADKKAKEEANRKAKEEADKKAREEADRQAKEAERKKREQEAKPISISPPLREDNERTQNTTSQSVPVTNTCHVDPTSLSHEAGSKDSSSKASSVVAAQEKEKNTSSTTARSTTDAVKVYCRVRPFLPQELGSNSGTATIQTTTPLAVAGNAIAVSNHSYVFEMCFNGVQGQEQRGGQGDFYAHVGPGLLQGALDGYHVCLLAYGQTGSGKTYSMMGPSAALNTTSFNLLSEKLKHRVDESEEEEEEEGGKEESATGFIPRFVGELFRRIEEMTANVNTSTAMSGEPSSSDPAGEITHQKHSFRVFARYFEIYNEKCFDLLNSNKEVKVFSNNDRIDGITENIVTTKSSILSLIKKGNACRATASTLKNERSSRSHAIFQIKVQHDVIDPQTQALVEWKCKQRNSIHMGSHEEDEAGEKQSKKENEEAKAKNISISSGTERGGRKQQALQQPLKPKTLSSVISLVDLAGSERLKDSGAEGERFTEMVNINKSLFTLRRVIQHLNDHPTLKPPIRDSLLTRVLGNAFGGNAKTIMLVTLSPSPSDIKDSVTTLQFSDVARKLVNTVHINLDSNSLLLESMSEEIKRLKSMLKEKEDGLRNAKNWEGTQEGGKAKEVEKASQMAQELERQMELYHQLELEIVEQAETQRALCDVIKEKEDGIVAFQREAEDVRKNFTKDFNAYLKNKPMVLQALTKVKEPLQRQPGCPKCHALQTECFVVGVQKTTLEEELSLLTTTMEQVYLDSERLRQKNEATTHQLAQLRNEMNVMEDQTMIIQAQQKMMENMQEQLEKYVQDRAEWSVTNFQLQNRIKELEEKQGGGS